MGAAERVRLARAARAVLGAEADRATARANRLRRQDARPSASFADLDAVPLWLPENNEERTRFIDRLGTAAVAPSLRMVIDGALLRKVADQVGPDLVDWGLALPDADREAAPLDQVPDVRALGHAVVQHAITPRLGSYFPTEKLVEPALAERAIEQARAA